MRRAVHQDALQAPFDGSGHAAERCCMHPGCTEAGLFRAPVARDRLNQYYWFCLTHVRAYNAQWDYFKGMSTAQIEAHLRADQTWQRPSWPFGTGPRVHDPFDLLGGERQRREPPPSAATPEEKALATLNLDRHAPFSEVKARYKILVKQLHPDANGGDRGAEERLKEVNRAYSTLRAAFS